MHGHEHTVDLADLPTGASDRLAAIMDRIAQQLHRGNELFLNDDFIKETAETLWKGAVEGYGMDLNVAELGGSDEKMLRQLRNNVFVFSGFKNFETLAIARDLLIGPDGKKRGFHAFKQEILKLHDTYNVRYLQAEYNLAQATATQAAKWTQDFPLRDRYARRYVAVMDGRTRDDHRRLHRVTLPMDDRFWDIAEPPNGWGCRCTTTLVPLDTAELSNPANARRTADKVLTKLDKNGNNRLAMFRNNPGKTGALFPESHPYFKVDQPARAAVYAFSEMASYSDELYPKRYFSEESGGYVVAHANADKSDFSENFEVGKVMANNGYRIEILEHLQTDGIKNPEYRVNGLISDLKTPDPKKYKTLVGGIKGGFRSAAKQRLDNAVIHIVDLNEPLVEIMKGLRNGFTHHKAINFVFVLKGDKVVRISREHYATNAIMDELKNRL